MMFTFKVRKLRCRSNQRDRERTQKHHGQPWPQATWLWITTSTCHWPGGDNLAHQGISSIKTGLWAYSWLLVNAGETIPLWTVPSLRQMGLGYIRKLVPALHSLHDGLKGNKTYLPQVAMAVVIYHNRKQTMSTSNLLTDRSSKITVTLDSSTT